MNYTYCYILFSHKNQKLYVSHTQDLREELRLHNEGEVEVTLNEKPWDLIWYSAFVTKDKALEFEEYLKCSEGEDFIYQRLLPLSINLLKEKPQNMIVCPICKGSGEAPNETYYKYGKGYSGKSVFCSNCKGRGWIEKDTIHNNYD